MWTHFRINHGLDQNPPRHQDAVLPALPGLAKLPGNLRAFGGELPLGKANAAKILRRSYDPYRTIEIPKRDGSSRHISVPSFDLRKFQANLLKTFLSVPEVAHSAAFAYVKGRSAIQCARLHEQAVWAIKVDIKNFFESIDEKQVYWAFRARGVPNFRSFFLARFATRLEMQPSEVKKSLRHYFTGKGTPPLRKYRVIQRHKLLNKFTVERRRIGYLPQGAPTSGQVSNLVFYPIDVKLAKIAKENDAVYTRYADDIVFSFTSSFSRTDAEATLRLVSREVQVGGFILNHKKTRILKPGTRMQILGVLIGEPGMRLPHSKKKALDKRLRAVEKFGFESHARDVEEIRSYSLLNQIHGFLIWANDVEPDWAAPRLAKLSRLVAEQLASKPFSESHRKNLDILAKSSGKITGPGSHGVARSR